MPALHANGGDARVAVLLENLLGNAISQFSREVEAPADHFCRRAA